VSRVEGFTVKFHPAAQCRDCLWAQVSSPITRRNAKSHVRDTGHVTTVTVEERTTYTRDET
jgi:hypothetical protein